MAAIRRARMVSVKQNSRLMILIPFRSEELVCDIECVGRGWRTFLFPVQMDCHKFMQNVLKDDVSSDGASSCCFFAQALPFSVVEFSLHVY